MDTKKLRQKILDLAIHGKLVPQDPNDEPASVLLERIRAEKERLIQEGKIKRSKKSASDTPHYENVPFEVPESWEWSNVESFTYDLQYGTSEKSSNEGDVPVLRMGNISRIGTIDFTDLVYSSNKDDINKYALLKNDLLFNRTNSSEWVGKTAIFKSESPAIYAGYLIRVRCILVCPDYINFALNSSYHREWCNRVKTDAVNQSNINAQKLSKHLIPIPPYEEQLRIVIETKKWLNFIDKIEEDVSDFENVISKTKSKILDLAIHGKLVPQDPNDEPAIDLLTRINPTFTPCDNAHYENLPDTWLKIPLGSICTLSEGEPITDKEYPYIDVKGLRTGNYASKRSGKYVPAGTTLILVDGENSGEVFHIPVEGYQGSTMKVLDIANNMNAQYVLFFVMLYQKALRENKVGSAIPHLNKKMFRELVIPVPPIEEQERIVRAIQQRYRILDNISANL